MVKLNEFDNIAGNIREFRKLFKPNQNRDLVIICVGTDRSTGDSLGPMVGSYLKATTNLNVYGTLDEPVHAVNMQEILDEVEDKYTNPFVVGIDASLGRTSSIGRVDVIDKPLKPGTGVGKEHLPPIGECHIRGIVNTSGYMEYFVLQSTRLSTIVKLSQEICQIITEVTDEIQRPEPTGGTVVDFEEKVAACNESNNFISKVIDMFRN